MKNLKVAKIIFRAVGGAISLFFLIVLALNKEIGWFFSTIFIIGGYYTVIETIFIIIDAHYEKLDQMGIQETQVMDSEKDTKTTVTESEDDEEESVEKMIKEILASEDKGKTLLEKVQIVSSRFEFQKVSQLFEGAQLTIEEQRILYSKLNKMGYR